MMATQTLPIRERRTCGATLGTFTLMSTIAVYYRPASKDANFCCNKRWLAELWLGNLTQSLDAGIFLEAPEVDATDRRMSRRLKEFAARTLERVNESTKMTEVRMKRTLGYHSNHIEHPSRKSA